MFGGANNQQKSTFGQSPALGGIGSNTAPTGQFGLNSANSNLGQSANSNTSGPKFFQSQPE
jgi:hypothetical protein